MFTHQGSGNQNTTAAAAADDMEAERGGCGAAAAGAGPSICESRRGPILRRRQRRICRASENPFDPKAMAPEA